MEKKDNIATRVKSDRQLVFYDGDCFFCKRAVRYIIKNDISRQFYFVSIRTRKALIYLSEASNRVRNSKSVIARIDNRFYYASTAILMIAIKIDKYKFWAKLFLKFPRVLRDWVYYLFASQRYFYSSFIKTCPLSQQDFDERIISD
ncbi:MAG: DUF393 domain-containing protein [Bacteroidales bacterium]